ncbi:MAG: hypothetical protein PWP46_2025 [Fusobacteriaceae bacterium]|nr:hypothetical protein [Fusobacteriaceae bacterium]
MLTLLSKFDNVNLTHKYLSKDKLWQDPHNQSIDFEGTALGAEWIDERAQSAKSIIDSYEYNRKIIAHSDWSNKHFRFRNDDVSVIYDWDSLCYIDELYAIGIACTTFTATWEIDVQLFPTPEELYRFLNDFCEFSGRVYTRDEIKVISAYVAHTIAYIVRCMHAINSDEVLEHSIRDGQYF